MKIIGKSTLFNLVILILVFTIISAHAQNNQSNKNITWEEVKASEQIPEATLATISTEELINLYLNSRYSYYLLGYNSVHDALENAYNDFNGLRELLNREDAARELIKFYQKMDIEDYNPNWESVKRGAFTFSFVFIEVLLAHELIHEKLTNSEVKELLTELLMKNEYKINHSKVHSIIGIQFNTYSIARLLESKGREIGIAQELFQISGIMTLLNTGRLQDYQILPLIIQKSEEFLNEY